MTGVVPALPKFQFESATGAPLANGTVDVYLAGTTTRTNTWQDPDLTVLNANPIVLDSRGEATIYLDPDVTYKFVLKNSGGATQWTQDNISGSSFQEVLPSILDYIPISLHAAIKARTSTTDLSSYIADAYEDHEILRWPAGRYYVASSIDLTSIYGAGVVGDGATQDYGTEIVINATNTPGLRLWGPVRVENLYIHYATQQSTSNTDSRTIEFNNIASACVQNVRAAYGNTNYGIKRANFASTGQNTVFSSAFINLYSLSASECHYDFRNFNGGGTNCSFSAIYGNGGGSLDFSTAGQSCNYFLRGTNWSNYTFAGVSFDGGEFVQRVTDLTNCYAVFNDWRVEALKCKKDADGWFVAGGADSSVRIGLISVTGCRALLADAPNGTSIVRGNATRTILSVGAVTLPTNANSSYTTPTFRVLNAGATDATSQFRVGPVYDPSAYLNDSWTGTDHILVYEYNGKETIEAIRAGRSTTSAFRKGCTASALPSTGATGDRAEVVNPGDIGRPYQYVYSSSFLPSAFVGGQYPIASVGDTDLTLTPATSRPSARFGTALTANRTVTLSTTGAWNGCSFLISRPASGAFTIDVGGLKSLAAGEWCRVVYDGSNWRLMEFGSGL
jgi:hypothetical protein